MSKKENQSPQEKNKFILEKESQEQKSQSPVPLSLSANTRTTSLSMKSGGMARGTLQRITSAQKIYAKAVYDNFADTPDELAFKKGEILTVIEQDADGCEGWWLCTIRGRQGICPGNRLRIINSYDSGCFSPSPASSPCPSLAASTATLNSSISSSEIYENSSIISGCGFHGNGSQTQLQQQSQQHHHQHHHHHHITQQSHNNLHLQQQLQHRLGKRRSWHITPHKVITPQRHGDVYIYNNCTPPSLHQQQLPYYQNHSTYQNISMMSLSSEFETYDTPKPVTPVNYDCPKNWSRIPTTLTNSFTHLSTNRHEMMSTPVAGGKSCSTPVHEESYDIPRPLNLFHQQNMMTPSSSNSSLLTSDSLSLSFSSSNRSSLANMPDYDIPRRNPISIKSVQHQQQQNRTPPPPPLQLQQQQQQQHSEQTNGQHLSANPQQVNGGTHATAYDFPQPVTLSTTVQANSALHQLAAAATKELPLELSSALEALAKLQLEATTAITRLLSFVTPGWRVQEKLEPIVMEVKLAAVRLRTALHDLTEFSEGALGNATRSEDRNLALKLRPLVKALRDADKLIHDSSETLNAQSGWNAGNLSRKDDKSATYPPDSLDQLIACAQTLIEDVRQTTSFIQGNALLLFKRNTKETPAGNGGNSNEWLEDYDYVSFESKDAAAKKNSALREAIPQNLKKKFDNVIKAAEAATVMAAAGTPTEGVGSSGLNSNDKLLVRYYALQITTHMGNLRQAIDSFLETVEKNQPPKFFIAYGKFVVVSAHNLVTIGDIVHRNVSKEDLKDKILGCTDALSDALKTCVAKSKKAAQQFPSVTAVQEMVDSVVDISHLASDLKTAMLQAVQLTL